MSVYDSDLDPMVLVVAGGTGGHLFPAEALSEVLVSRGLAVELVTDTRTTKYSARFPARNVHQIASGTPSGGSPFAKAKAFALLGMGTFASLLLVNRVKPAVVVGFGGYPTVPPLIAANLLRIPTVLHEANAVMGRANRFLGGRVDKIAKGFDTASEADKQFSGKTVVTGNPVRPAVLRATTIPFPEFENGRLRVLVTGGSQGARIMSEVVPAAIGLLPEETRRKFIIVQQSRPEDLDGVRATYARLGVEATVESFFSDLPARIAAAHLVISRAGASTVSELSVIGRPSILVPFPHAIDQDQAANAAHLAESGAATVVPQTRFTPQWLSEALDEALKDPGELFLRGELAKRAGITDAAERLADVVQSFIKNRETPQ